MIGIKRKQKPDGAITESTFSCQREGLTIRGTEFRPAGDHLPVAIVCHGFMAWKDTVRHYALELARLGYCAYCFDFCGGSVLGKGKSDGATTDMSVLTQVRDLEAVMAYVQSLPYNSEELLLMGGSQGGFVSALTAARHPQQVDKLVLLFPALCIPDDARTGKMMFARFDPANIPPVFHCGPMKLGRCYAADVLEMDPFAQIAGYPGPVLILHGTQDNIVKPEYSQRAQSIYANARLEIIPGGGHGFSARHDAIAIAHLKEFAKRKEVNQNETVDP